MAEVLQNMQPVYERWESRRTPASGVSPSHLGTKGLYSRQASTGKEAWREKFGDQIRPPPYRRTKSRHKKNNTTYSQVDATPWASFKSLPSVKPESFQSRRPFMGRCCACMPSSRASFYQEDKTPYEQIHDIFRVDTKKPHNPWLTRTFYHLSYAMRRDRSHKYPDVTMSVLVSPRVMEAIQKSMQEELANNKNVSEAVMKKRAKSLYKQMRNNISGWFTRFTGWFLHKFLGRILMSLQIHMGQIEMVKRVCKRDLPVIFLPCHRSHLDYILLTFLLWNSDLPSPNIAAGDNLNMPFWSMLAKALGGFFIRRKLDKGDKKDHIYRAILQAYMQELLRCNQSFEFFIEGGRTRTGKPCTPKGGLLSVIVDAYQDGIIPDAYIVPVSISYEKIIEGSFRNELMGLPKKGETFWRAWAAVWKMFNSQFGNVRVDFSQPFSLKEYLQVCQSFSFNQLSVGLPLPETSESTGSDRPVFRHSLSSASYNSEIVNEENRMTVQSLAEHVIYYCGRYQAVMSTQLLSFILLNRFREGARLSQLCVVFEWLMNELYMRGRDVGFCGKVSDVIMHGAQVLGPEIIQIQPGSGKSSGSNETADVKNNNTTEVVLRPVVTLPDVFDLTYYANTVTPTFAVEAALATALHACIDHDHLLTRPDPEPTLISQETLFQKASYLCQFLQFEFTFRPPCVSLETALHEALDQLLASEVLEVCEEEQPSNLSNEKRWANRFSSSLSWADEDDDFDDGMTDRELKVNFNGSTERLKFLLNILGPYVEGYYIMACHLAHIKEDPKLTENDLVKRVHSNLVERAQGGVALFAESASLDLVKNAAKAFKHLKVMQVTTDKTLQLTLPYQEDNILGDLVDAIHAYKL